MLTNRMQMLGDILIKIIADYMVIAIVIIGGIAMLRLPTKARHEWYPRALIMGLVALLFARIASLFYQGAARPFELMGVDAKAAYLNNPGFPSDHVLFVTAITIVVWVSSKNRRLALALLVLSVLVGLGRLLALVHSLQDVLGGVICAGLAGIVVYGSQLWAYKQQPNRVE